MGAPPEAPAAPLARTSSARHTGATHAATFLAPCASAWLIDCLYHLPVAEDEEETYAPCLKAWTDAFSADQLFVLQVGQHGTPLCIGPIHSGLCRAFACCLAGWSLKGGLAPLRKWLAVARAHTRAQVPVASYLAAVLLPTQYENLTDGSRMRGALRDVKRFVGIDAKLPHDDLGLHNSRKGVSPARLPAVLVLLLLLLLLLTSRVCSQRGKLPHEAVAVRAGLISPGVAVGWTQSPSRGPMQVPPANSQHSKKAPAAAISMHAALSPAVSGWHGKCTSLAC